MRRPQATAESKARAERIARSLAGLLNDVPVADPSDTDEDGLTGMPLPTGVSGSTAGPLICPRCAGAMDMVSAGHGVEIDQCRECGAIWLDAGELEALVADQQPEQGTAPTMGELRARMREVVPGEVAVKYRDCPRCQQVMRRTNFGTISGVVVDECVQHGVLLDPGELQAIEVFVRMGGRALGEEVRLEHGQRVLAPPPPPPQPVSYEERRRQAAAITVFDLLFRW